MQYKLTYKKIKNINIRIRNNEIVVSAPLNMPFTIINNFVQSKASLIEKALLKQQQQKNKYEITNTVRIFSHIYSIKYATKFKIENDVIYIENDSQLNRFLRNKLEKYINNRVEYYYNLMRDYFPKPKIKYSYLKGKWGVCYTRKATIAFSYKLVHTYLDFVDYVIVHELSHFVHPNHSKAFYHFVEKYMPNYKEIIQKEKNML